MSGILTQSVEVAASRYDIEIGAGLLDQAAARMAAVLPPGKARLCVVTDENVAKAHLPSLMKNLEAAGYTVYPPVILPAGEETKSFERLQYVIERALSYKLDRKSALVALGGGVVGDLAGFAASIILRGIDFIQIPTTLLAQVDSSVGGKTGINTAQGKNLVGSFYQPRLVLIDPASLSTLPPRELRAGYAEVVKYGLINDAGFYHWLEENGQALLAGDASLQKEAIARSCAAKAAVVAADEKETLDIRALLNLGHTFGHALEALGGYDGRLLHGEAVSIGMLWAFEFSANLGLAPADDAARLRWHLEKTGLMTAPPFAVGAQDVLDRMRGDKKNSGGGITLVLARGIGKAFVSRDHGEAALADFLRTKTGDI